MALNLQNLDDETRKYMVQEIEWDIQQARLYISPRLTPQGANEYPQLLKNAATSGDDSSLAAELSIPGRLNATESRNTKSGVIWAKVPITAPQTMAEGEFNRFYARGLCLRAIAAGIPNLVIYRAKQVENPRSVSLALIGQSVTAEKLLNDLRENIGTDTALGLPPGPNSGLSVRLP
jgi:hypothetical protein